MDLPIKNCDFPIFSIAILVYQRVDVFIGKSFSSKREKFLSLVLTGTVIFFPSPRYATFWHLITGKDPGGRAVATLDVPMIFPLVDFARSGPERV